MSTGSNIEWTDATWTPVKGCTRASEGCDHCYAVTMTHRLEKMGQSKYAGLTVLNNRGERHFNGQVVCDADALAVPLRWKKPRRVFVSSMSDIFHKDVPFDFLDQIFAVMALCPQHTFQVLTKRPERMAEYFESSRAETMVQGRVLAQMYKLVVDQKGTPQAETYRQAHKNYHADYGRSKFWPLPNVWLGTSVESQRWADERIPHLLKCPAAVRFLSMEPLLGPVDVTSIKRTTAEGYMRPLDGRFNTIGWVIVGGESGPKARPCDVAWIRSIVQQCKAAGVPCFVKQLGSRPIYWNTPGSRFGPDVLMSNGEPLKDRKGGDMAEWPSDLRVREMPGVAS